MGLYTYDYVMCPWCEGKTGSRVDHLYPGPTSFGPWYCDSCGQSFSGEVLAPGNVTVVRAPGKQQRTRSMALLKFDGREAPVYFVFDHGQYDSGRLETEAERQEHCRYFFEEHSCPTNWLENCVAVIDRGDCDPHGFLTFVRFVDVPQDFDESDDEQWPLLFPEAFNAPTIDGEAREVIAPLRITTDKSP